MEVAGDDPSDWILLTMWEARNEFLAPGPAAPAVVDTWPVNSGQKFYLFLSVSILNK